MNPRRRRRRLWPDDRRPIGFRSQADRERDRLAARVAPPTPAQRRHRRKARNRRRVIGHQLTGREMRALMASRRSVHPDSMLRAMGVKVRAPHLNPRRRNPAPAGPAADLFKDLHWGIPARRQSMVRRPELGAALTSLGRLEAIEYATNKVGDGPSVYRHRFGEEGGRKPHLAVDPKSRDLHIVGGSYTVERRGIVD
jgi:hypothetical protein